MVKCARTLIFLLLLLLLENSDIDSQWYNGRFKLSIFRAVPGF